MSNNSVYVEPDNEKLGYDCTSDPVCKENCSFNPHSVIKYLKDSIRDLKLSKHFVCSGCIITVGLTLCNKNYYDISFGLITSALQ